MGQKIQRKAMLFSTRIFRITFLMFFINEVIGKERYKFPIHSWNARHFFFIWFTKKLPLTWAIKPPLVSWSSSGSNKMLDIWQLSKVVLHSMHFNIKSCLWTLLLVGNRKIHLRFGGVYGTWWHYVFLSFPLKFLNLSLSRPLSLSRRKLFPFQISVWNLFDKL